MRTQRRRHIRSLKGIRGNYSTFPTRMGDLGGSGRRQDEWVDPGACGLSPLRPPLEAFEGPGARFESAAEVRMMRTLGCDAVTASIPTEMIYAHQLGINYGCIVGIVNPAEGLGDWDWNTLSDCYPAFHRQSVAIYHEAIPRVAALAGKQRALDQLRIHPEFETPDDT